MADTQRNRESEQQRGNGVGSHKQVEVYEANPADSTQQGLIDDMLRNPGVGNADRHDARVVTGDAESATFRTTDLRDTELNTTTGLGNSVNSDSSAAGQGTNWGTILMVIAIILVIILLGSWLF